jgi:iron complex transport system ATP-binding protein
MTERKVTVRIETLKIGFHVGRETKALLPPLSASGEKGELIAVIGRNGIGKSTLLRSMAGIQEILDGKISYNDTSINFFGRNELAHMIGYISTEPVRVSNMTVFDLVALGRFPYTNWFGTLEKSDVETVTDALDKTNIRAFSEKYIAELSDGERQRAMIARLVAQDANVMLMDEPTAFLDIRSKYEIIHLLHELSHHHDKTIIFTTHDLDLAVRHSDRIWLLLDDGIKEGAPEDLMISGMFEHLFDSEILKFNSADGIYSFNTVPADSIFIEGEEMILRWTERAVTRAGFSVSKVKNSSFIEITPEKRWILNYRGIKKEYSSIYELTRDMLYLI